MYDEKRLDRFITQQEAVYKTVVEELKRGEKRTHCMWYIFPQVKGLGHSTANNFYSISGPIEAKAYLSHPILGKRLIECCELLLKIEGKKVDQIFGYPDDLKLRSCMTLFDFVSPETKVFDAVLKKYFNGARDMKSLELLE